MALDIFPNKTYVDKIKEYLESLISQISLTWDKITGKPDFKAVATSGSYNDLTDKPTIPEGADVLTLDGTRVIKNGTTEITTYDDLLALVTKGGVVLLDTVAGTIAKEALFHPHMADDTAIRFDATGTLGGKIYTRSFAFTPKSGGGISIERGNLTEVAKKSDVPAVVAPASDTALAGKAADAYETGKKLDEKADAYIHFVSPSTAGEIAFIEENPLFVNERKSEKLVDFTFDGETITYNTETESSVSGEKISVNRAADGVCLISVLSTGKSNIYVWDEAVWSGDYRSERVERKGQDTAKKANGLTDSAKTALFADTAFSDKVQEIVNDMFDNADTTQYGGEE